MKTPFLGLALLSTLALSLSAQETPLVVQTSDMGIAMGITSSFGSLGALPALTEGQHYVLTLGQAGIDVATSSGDVGLMQIVAKPGALMELFSDEIAQYQGVAQGMMMLSMGQQGMKPGDVAAMVQAVFDFPDQVESLNLKLTGDASSLGQGFGAEFGLVPKQGTWFASLVDTVTQVSAGAPVLSNPGAALHMNMGMNLESLEPLEPLFSMFTGMGGGSEEDSQKQLEMMRKGYAITTGGMSMTWDIGGSGMQIIGGVTDPEVAAELLTSEDYMQLANTFGTAGIEMVYVPNAFDHRGVQVHKMTMDLGVPSPLTPTGAMESYYAVAGNYSLTSAYSDADGIKALIDTVLDQKVKLQPMPGNTLATFSMQFAGFLNMMGGGVPMGDMPESINMELSKSNGQILIKMDLK